MSDDFEIRGNVKLKVRDAIAHVRLNRPDRLNALDRAMVYDLAEALEGLVARSDLRVIVIGGEGRAFCAGGDLAPFAANEGRSDDVVDALLPRLHELLILLSQAPQAVVFSVHGTAAGAGMSLSFMGDFCIAADNAQFVPAYAGIGLTPDGGGTVGLVRALGPRQALRLLLAEDRFPATLAHSMGLVTRLVPEAELGAETLAFARRLARLDPGAVAGTRRLVMQSSGRDLAAQLETEMAELKQRMRSDTFRSAVRRFADA